MVGVYGYSLAHSLVRYYTKSIICDDFIGMMNLRGCIIHGLLYSKNK